MSLKTITTSDLIKALTLHTREHIALVGGGGKTTLLFALAEACLGREKRVVTGTTTKVWYYQALKAPRMVLVQEDPSWKERLRDGLSAEGHVFLGQEVLASRKVGGISPSLADDLYAGREMDYLLLEADGAAGLPLKAHAPHEPVIPRSVTKVVAVIGLEALGRPFSRETVFRDERFREITGCLPGQRLSAPIVAGLLFHPLGLFKGAPDSAQRIVFLNKADLLTDAEEAEEMAHLILGQSLHTKIRVVMGSVKTGQYTMATEEKNGGHLSQSH